MSSEKKSFSKLKIASHGKRLMALILDLAFAILLVNTISRLNYSEHWDLLPPSESSLFSVVSIYMTVLFLLILKDCMKGGSPGKFIFGITTRQLDDLSKAPPIKNLILRNLFLIILPVEGVILLLDSHGRRLGDKMINTVVLENPKSTRFVIRLMTANTILIGFFFSAYFIQPLVLKKSAAYQTAISYIKNNQEIVTRLGFVNDFESPEMNINITEFDGQALVRLNCVGTINSSYVQVHLNLMLPERVWKAKRLEIESD